MNFNFKKIMALFNTTSKTAVAGLNHNQPMAASNNTAAFMYRYEDAAVPPAFHRSYTITVTAAAVYFSVDSYGELLLKKTFALPAPRYQQFVKAIEELHIKNKEEVQPNGCSGGTLNKLHIQTGQAYKVEGYVYNCNQQQFGNLEGNVAKAIALFKALVPGIEGFIKAAKQK